ncbi:MAG: hypothetical protein H6R27_646 [Proteobacteria bacterium]|nr:hypothetical protein [Pseudomonadota bacterium]
MTTGTCLCGAVRYEIDGPFSMMAICHCSMCRKEHGTQFATFVGAPLSGFRWLSGEDNITDYASSPSGHRYFCRTCGSPAPMLIPAMDMVVAPAGNLEQDPGIRPQMHLFVGSKAPGYVITDDLPQYDAYPPEWGGGGGVKRPTVTAPEGIVPGSCLCGGVAWEVTGKPSLMMNCHCSRCRRGRGAAHATNAFYKLDQFRWVRGEELTDSFKVPDAQFFTQHFCRVCGSPTPRVMEKFNRVLVPAGAFDADPGVQPTAHIFVAYKAPWFEITDDIPQFSEMMPR